MTHCPRSHRHAPTTHTHTLTGAGVSSHLLRRGPGVAPLPSVAPGVASHLLLPPAPRAPPGVASHALLLPPSAAPGVASQRLVAAGVASTASQSLLPAAASDALGRLLQGVHTGQGMQSEDRHTTGEGCVYGRMVVEAGASVAMRHIRQLQERAAGGKRFGNA